MHRTISSRLLLSADDRQSDSTDIENPPDRLQTRRGARCSLPVSTSRGHLLALARSSSGLLSHPMRCANLLSRPMQGSVLSPNTWRYVSLSLGCIIASCQIYFFPGIVLPALYTVAILFLVFFFLKTTSRIDLGFFRNREGSLFFNSTDQLSAVRRSRICGLAVEMLGNGTVYAGEFKRGILTGRGERGIPESCTYAGDWVGGVPHGYGVENLAGHGLYIGQFSGNKKTGYGLMLYSNGDEYKGQWLNGKRHGIGRHKTANGSTYEGQFVQDTKQGHGEYHYSRGDHTYQGQFHNDKCTGEGILFYSFGDRYEGSWHEDQMEGYGVYIQVGDEQILPGMWVQGVRTVPMPISDPCIERAVQMAREAAESCRKLNEIEDEVDKAVKNAGEANGDARALATKAHSLNNLHPLHPRRLAARALSEIIESFQDLRRTLRNFGSSTANLARSMAGRL